RSAQAVEGDPAGPVGKAGEQRRHPGEVAIVLAGLVGAAEDDVVELVPVDSGIALDQGGDRDGREIVGADMGKRSAVAADRRADGVADEGFGHESSCVFWRTGPPIVRDRPWNSATGRPSRVRTATWYTPERPARD